MKDRDDNILHIDDYVTFTDEARPKWLIGRHGWVTRLGDIRIMVEIESVLGDEPESRRVDPKILLVGNHTFEDESFTQLMQNESIKLSLINYVASILDQAVKDGAISVDQKEEILWYV